MKMSARARSKAVSAMAATLYKAIAALNQENLDGMRPGLLQIANEIEEQSRENSNVIEFVSEHVPSLRLVADRSVAQ